MSRNLYKDLETQILTLDGITENDRSRLLKSLMEMKKKRIGILIVGFTGVGKSATISALCNMEVVTEEVVVDSDTVDIEKYEFDNLTLYISIEFGGSKETDMRYMKNITEILHKNSMNGDALIDLVIVIVDSSTRDIETAYELINNVIVPNLGPRGVDRILIALNHADTVMKGRNWNYEKNESMIALAKFLEKRESSFKHMIKESTGGDIDFIFYSAGYKEEGKVYSQPYNISKLLYYIVKKTPSEKRAVYVNNLNIETEVWKNDDGEDRYIEKTQLSILDTIRDVIQVVDDGIEVDKGVVNTVKKILYPAKNIFGFIFG